MAFLSDVENTGLTPFFRWYRPPANRKAYCYRSPLYLEKNPSGALLFFFKQKAIRLHEWLF
jgi:hypothetical protein